MPIGPVVVASQNEDKILEMEAVLASIGIEVSRGHVWPEIPETEPTLEGNALLKARCVVQYTGLPAVADDTGLEVAALGGAPGVFTARYAGEGATYGDNVSKLVSELGSEVDRAARFRTVVAFVDTDGTELVVQGTLDGTITTSPRGVGGFGYDPVFEVDGRTLAEMGAAEKNVISHRGRALRALAVALEDQLAQ